LVIKNKNCAATYAYILLDIMGVVIQDNGVTEIVTKSTGRPVSKELRLHIH
jgi:hypothetical protein